MRLNTLRFLVMLAVGLCVASLAVAQRTGKVPRVGVLVPFMGPATTLFSEVFRHELRELGYVEGQSLTLEYRSAEGRYERLPALVAELVALQVDVIVTWSMPAALAAKHATSTLPIVFTAVADPMLSGLVASFARPGGNITGVTHIPSELDVKRLELLTEAVPSATRIAVLWHPEFPPNVEGMPALQRAAQTLSVVLLPVAYRDAQDFEAVLAAMHRDGAAALFVMPHPTTSGHATRLAALAPTHQLPAMAPYREFAEAGGLLAYGARFADLYQRAAALVDKILKGATPSDVPE